MTDTMFVDLFDPSSFVDGVPHEYFAWLRANDPVRMHPEPDGPGFWAVTRHADVLAVSRDPEAFSSQAGSALIFDVPEPDLEFLRRQLIHMDPPAHSKLRAIVKTGFTPRHVAQLESSIVGFARDIVDRISTLGECDFVTEVAAELPLLVLAEILGVSPGDRHLLFDWSNRLIGLEDPEYQQHGSADMTARIALVEMFQYAHELAESKRAAPTDDIISTLVTAEVDGERLDDIDFNLFFFLLVVAGNETTRNALSGGLWALHEHPDERRRLEDDPALLPPAVEEILRWVSPVMEFRRTAMRDTVIGEQAIGAGDKVVVYYSSANRDEAAFENAAHFDIGRHPNPHLAFGFGTHFCLGSNLARLELRVLFDELLRRLPDIAVTAPPERLRSNFINGIKHLPVTFTPAA
jgi:cytochrome P450